MEPQEPQAPTGDNTQRMPPDALSATLAHATNLQEQTLPQAPQEPQNAPQQVEGPKSEEEAEDKKITDLEGKMDKKMEILRDEMKSTIKTEIGSIKDEIKSILANDTED